MRYYLLRSPAGEEVVRIINGSATYFDMPTGRWIPDPLLALEVRVSGDWREVAPHELPPALAHLAEGAAPSRKSRRGRHSRK
jgi:hypothetical protein